MSSLVRFGLVIALVLASCGDESRTESEAEGAVQPEVGSSPREAPPPRSPPTPPSPEEQRRRAEAVRRAAEELSLRGVGTEGYLMNLIVEDDAYRIAFVKRSGGSLRSEITVRVGSNDFEILSVEAPDGAGGR